MSAIRFPWQSFYASAAWGAIVWLILFLIQTPGFRHDEWARLVLLLAALVWAPLCFARMDRLPGWFRRFVFPAAVCLVISFQQSPGYPAVVWSLPWLALIAIVFIDGVKALCEAGRDIGKWAIASAQLFWVIGGYGIFADRLGLRPFDFDPAIILLTAVHFHYAGFIFPLLLGWAVQHWPLRVFRVAAFLSMVSVPFTALGITLAQISGYFWLETGAAIVVALSGWLAAWGYLQAGLGFKLPPASRICWVCFALCLMFSMTLAVGYACRPFYPIDWLNIPSMRALHGSANAIGVAGGGLLGWYFYKTPFAIKTAANPAR